MTVPCGKTLRASHWPAADRRLLQGEEYHPRRLRLRVQQNIRRAPRHDKGGTVTMSKQYETVIGLEVHVELATKTKFSADVPPNLAEHRIPTPARSAPVCRFPAVLNKQVVEYALAVGLATNCGINQYCKFDRKNYFYPDNPQNYQISQLYLPICHDGWVEIDTAAGKRRSASMRSIWRRMPES